MLSARTGMRGTITLPTPRAWLRTSGDDVALASFGPVPAGAGCRAWIVAQPVATATRSPAAFVAGAGYIGAPTGGGHDARGAWAVRATAATDSAPWLSAIAITRVAPRRYAGASIFVDFAPGCPAGAGREPALVTAVTRAVRRSVPHVRIARGE